MVSFTGENLFSRMDLLQSTSTSLPKQICAGQASEVSPGHPAKRRRKSIRVLYPSQRRRYLPRQEANLVKRWLLFLIGVIVIQIFTEDPEQEGLGGRKVLGEHQPCAMATLKGMQLKTVSNCSGEGTDNFPSGERNQALLKTAANESHQTRS